jgi:hypothetical protein
LSSILIIIISPPLLPPLRFARTRALFFFFFFFSREKESESESYNRESNQSVDDFGTHDTTRDNFLVCRHTLKKTLVVKVQRARARRDERSAENEKDDTKARERRGGIFSSKKETFMCKKKNFLV